MNRYQIHVHGHLSDEWSSWFDDWTLVRRDDGTMLITGPAIDQAALIGMVNRVHHADLPLISLVWIGIDPIEGFEWSKNQMRFLMFVYSNPNEEERPMNEWMAFHSQYGANGKMQVAERLQPVDSAKTVDRAGASDGSRNPGDEYISGVYIFDCVNMEEALKIAANCPASKTGAVEVRPIFMPPQS